jgi:ABC-type branched-subunit amino acid transport system substrate-binding protein
MKRVFAVGVGLVLATAMAGCGGSDSNGESGDAAIKVMVFGSFSQPPFALAQIETAAKAAVKAVNADGGVDGAEIELISCDDKMSANGATACARKAVDEDVAAVVGAFTLFGDNIVPLLEKANIPYVLPVAISPKETTSKVSFPVETAGTPGAVAELALSEAGCKTIVLTSVENAQSAGNYEAYFLPVAKQLGFKPAKVFFPATTTDFSGVAAQIADLGDCVIYAGASQQTASIITALDQSGKDVKGVAISSISLDDTTLKQLGPVADGVQIFAPIFYPTTEKPAVKEAVKNIRAEDANAIVDETALNAYAAVLTFVEAAKAVTGDVDGAAVIKSLNSGTKFDVGMYAPTDFTAAPYFPQIPRATTSVFQPYVAKGGVYVPDGEPLDVAGRLGG